MPRIIKVSFTFFFRKGQQRQHSEARSVFADTVRHQTPRSKNIKYIESSQTYSLRFKGLSPIVITERLPFSLYDFPATIRIEEEEAIKDEASHPTKVTWTGREKYLTI